MKKEHENRHQVIGKCFLFTNSRDRIQSGQLHELMLGVHISTCADSSSRIENLQSCSADARCKLVKQIQNETGMDSPETAGSDEVAVCHRP
jgi:hypothetical protein